MSSRLEQAAKENDLETIKTLHAEGRIDVSSDDCYQAVCSALHFGHIHCLAYLRENCKYQWSIDEWMEAIFYIPCLKYLHEHGFTIPEEAIELAAEEGKLESIIYMREILHVEWHPQTLSTAAKKGHHSIIQYALSNGCKCEANDVLQAIENGHLACLQCFIENGFEVRIRFLLLAVNKKQWDCFNYLLVKTKIVHKKLFQGLDAVATELDFIKYPSFRSFFGLLKTGHASPTCNENLYNVLLEKREEMLLQREFAENNCSESLSKDVTQHVLTRYI